jgi:hypothetical protein
MPRAARAAILHLDRGPLDLKVLGLTVHPDKVVHLDKIVLDHRSIRPG